MKSLRSVFILFTVFLALPTNVLSDDLPLKVTQLSDKTIIVSNDEYGSGPQVAIATQKGIVVISTLWSEDIARKYRGVVEKAFGRRDFVYVINNRDRLDYVGGNSVYPEAEIIAHETIFKNLKEKENNLDKHLTPLIEMWEWKAGLSQKRLEKYLPNSDDAKSERSWLSFCRHIANDLSREYKLILPSVTFQDTLRLDMGDLTLSLYNFGQANYEGGIIIHISEEKLLFTGFLFSTHHLIPSPNATRTEIDPLKWIEVLNVVLADTNQVERIVCGPSEVHPRQWIVKRRDYIKELWHKVNILNNRGVDLETIQDYLSIENSFTYLKHWDTWQQDGEEWTKLEHQRNIKTFWSQLQTFASDIIETTMNDIGSYAAIRKYYELKNNPNSEYYFDEYSFNALGYKLLGQNRIQEAIAIFRLNAEAYPESSNVFDSLGEAYMKNNNFELAIQNYNKSLQLDPANDNAREMLKKIKSIVNN